MSDLVDDISLARRRRGQWLMNRRIISGIVAPTVLATVVSIELFSLTPGNSAIVLVSALSAIALAISITLWLAAIVHRACALHLLIFAKASTFATADERKRWFMEVREWLQVNGLIGLRANRCLYSLEDRKLLAWTYDAVIRRANSEVIQEAERQPSLEEVAIADQIEALPQMGSLLFYVVYWRTEATIRAMGYFLVLTAAYWLMSAPSDQHRPPINGTAIQNEVGGNTREAVLSDDT